MLSQQQFIVQLIQKASELTDQSEPSPPEIPLVEPYAFYGGAGAHMHPHPLPMLGETAEDEDRHIPHPIGRH
jgi:hypothetical protein